MTDQSQPIPCIACRRALADIGSGSPNHANDANSFRSHAFLTALLSRLWEEEEGFSGKRPFGNSGWKQKVWIALIKAEAVPGTLDSDGYVNEIDRDAADKIILDAIKALGENPS